MNTKLKWFTLVLAAVVGGGGFYAYSQRGAVHIPNDLRDAVADNGAFEALKGEAGGEADIDVPKPQTAVLRPTPVFDNNDKGFSRYSNPVMDACRGKKACFIALDGVERQLCAAYKENMSCFAALDGADRGWCEVLKDGKPCFMALDGADQDLCDQGRYPRRHMFWARCGNINTDLGTSNPVMDACRGKKACFIALDGVERQLCAAYKENMSCFAALDGADRGWCEVLKDGKPCFMALDGADRERCERGRFPSKHLFWTHCAKQ